ncbi:hypothetical protein BRETT_001253 [Brettanomyces bruxellensis]|uniref:histone acetyltransferase n=1 Tax=Dekkera bruxellensis TaxID=5007 RepID=A0A871R6M6_DEKBR|nr:uncharacterized protein BRETT_001253 [Brettanomyces bruxellensis]QOU21529.1 hypothetical protein BRETT_001253 [Brettanomyces bruxellensis]
MTFSLKNELEVVLPKGVSYQVLNLQSRLKESKCIIHHHKADHIHSYKSVHFIVLLHENKPLLALEVYVYLDVPNDQSQILRTVYISKADTSGLQNQKLSVGRIVQCFLGWICSRSITSYFESMDIPLIIDHHANISKEHSPFMSETDRRLHILIERSKGDKNYGMPKITKKSGFYPNEDLFTDISKHTTRLILFTRSEKQYLFPNSSKNQGKHILTDSQLLKWWMKNVEQIMGNNKVFARMGKKRINVLNADKFEVSRYIPSGSKEWKIGDIYTDKSNLHDAAVYHIPLLPDDPKGRFLEHLVVENRINKVRMKQFWTELSVRQEFRLGITVGLIGIEGESREYSMDNNNDDMLILFKRSEFNKIKELFVDIDYSDPVDYLRIKEGLKERKIILPVVKGQFDFTTLRQKEKYIHVQTLTPHTLTVRNKRRINPVVVNDIGSLVKRKRS